MTADGRRQVPRNEKDGVIVNDPKSIQERAIVADECAKSLKIAFPILLDNIDDAVERAYSGWPDRVFVIDQDGKVAAKGGPGPSGFKPSVDALTGVLDRVLTGSPTPQNPQPTTAPQRPGPGGPMMQQMKERLNETLQRMGLNDKDREATTAMWEQKIQAFQPVMQARQALMMSLQSQGNTDTAKLLSAFVDAQKKYTQQVEELDKALETKTELSKKPQVQAFLTAMGVLGINLAAPMMGPGGPPRPGN